MILRCYYTLVLNGVGWEAKKIEYKDAKPFPCVVGKFSSKGFWVYIVCLFASTHSSVVLWSGTLRRFCKIEPLSDFVKVTNASILMRSPA
jgi:hypothetical protein